MQHKSKPNVIFFTWMKEAGGGSGVREVAERLNESNAFSFVIRAVASPFARGESGKHFTRIQELSPNTQYIHFKTPKWWEKLPRFIRTPLLGRKHEEVARATNADLVCLSGWLKQVPVRSLSLSGILLRLVGLNRGVDPRRTINIHPAPLPEVGGAGVYGHHAHRKVMELYRKGGLTHSAVSMHFVTAEYDAGPIIFKGLVKIREDDTPETLGARVNKEEHRWQAHITNLVATGRIGWDGIHKSSLRLPEGYKVEQEIA